MPKDLLRYALRIGAPMVWLASLGLALPQPRLTPGPKVIQLDAKGQDYLSLLGGPPETVSMRSGLVVLPPGKSVGKHNTEDYEEMIIILDGQAELQLAGGQRFPLSKGSAAYCPPHTEHDVMNVGSHALRYIYVVAKATS